MASVRRQPKLSCLDCHQSSKSMKNRTFVDCVDPMCCIKELPDVDPRDYQVNRFCDRCLGSNYGYGEAEMVAATFVCPRCKGMENPNQRVRTVTPRVRAAKRVNNAEVEAQLVLVSSAGDDAAVPALRIKTKGLVDYLRGLADEQRTSIQATHKGLKQLWALATDGSGKEAPAVGAAAAAAADAATVVPTSGASAVAPSTNASVSGSGTQPEPPAAAAPQRTDSNASSPVAVTGESAASGESTEAALPEFAPLLLHFSGAAESGDAFGVEGDGGNHQPFAWTNATVDFFMNATDDDASKFASGEQQRQWLRFAGMYGETTPVPRVKTYTSRRAWKCQLESENAIPPVQVSLEIIACPAEFQAAAAEKRGHMQRLRKRVRSDTAGSGQNYDGEPRRQRLEERDERRFSPRSTVPLEILPQKKPLTTVNAKEISWCTLPPPVPPPLPPVNSKMQYKLEPDNVMRLDITGVHLTAEDEAYIMSLCDNPDVTLIIKGLTGGLKPALWTWEYLLARCGHVVWKKVRVFEKKDPTSSHWLEKGWRTMSLRDYYEYLLRRQAGDPDALSVVWYWIDFPMKEFLPELCQDFQRSSPVDLFPGGASCAQRWVTESARPDMGPNLYITPPGGRTWFHEDGNGTVDSGHQCMTGQNEVIMLRRITDEATRLNVLHLLNAGEGLDDARPHDDAVLSTATKTWPTDETIDCLRDELNAGPASLVLGPGEYLHINKGRLHAFRKKTPAGPETVDDICISVAWDWMYEGTESKGLRGEAATGIYNEAQNRLYLRQSLGIHSSTLLQGAMARLGELRATEAILNGDAKPLLGTTVAGRATNCSDAHTLSSASSEKLARKCAAVETFVSMVDDQENELARSEETCFRDEMSGAKVDVLRIDAFMNAGMGDTYCPDAFSPASYDCVICHAELHNVYLHCMGCQKDEYDYNLCTDCFKANRHTTNMKQHNPCGGQRSRKKVSSATAPANGPNCFCGEIPCVRCQMCSGRGGRCRCCMCYQFRWRYAPPADLSNLRKEYEQLAEEVRG